MRISDWSSDVCSSDLDNKYLYICASDDDHVEVMDLASHQIVRTLPSGPDPELFVLHPSGNPLYIANEDDNMVTVLDVASRSEERRVGTEGVSTCRSRGSPYR